MALPPEVSGERPEREGVLSEEKLVKTSLERWIKRLQADERKARFIEVPSAPAKAG